jgi:hypothetical protein
LPLEYLNDANLAGKLKEALKLAEDVARDALRKATWATSANLLTGDAGMSPDKDRVSSLVEAFAPQRLYWSRLELPYRELIVNLAASQEAWNCLIQNWFFGTLRAAALDAFDGTIGRLDGARELKAVTNGRGVLYGLLKKVQNDNRVPDLEPKEGAA